MAPGRIVVVPCAPRAPRGALRATGYLSHTSAADVAARLGFAPQRRMWAFRVCGVDFAVWAEKGSEASARAARAPARAHTLAPRARSDRTHTLLAAP